MSSNLNYSKKKRIVPENVLNYQYFQGVKQHLFIQ
jgi:hypothetical protein